MMQGVLCNIRVRLLFKDGMPNYRMKRKGVRKRKSVRGCIVDSQLRWVTSDREFNAFIPFSCFYD